MRKGDERIKVGQGSPAAFWQGDFKLNMHKDFKEKENSFFI